MDDKVSRTCFLCNAANARISTGWVFLLIPFRKYISRTCIIVVGEFLV